MTLTIRAPSPSDHAAWRPLWDAYNAFYGRSGATALPEPVTDLLWQRLLDPDVPICGLLAERSGRVVGLAHFLFHLSTSAEGPSTYLQDLLTIPDARGQGVGRALIAAVKVAARTAGSQRLYWHTHESNTTARDLYDRVAERSGFIVYRSRL